MTPQAFYTKWQVSQEEIATICSRSVSTVRRWFHKGRSYRRPTIVDLRHLALMDFLLDHFEQIPENLREALCPTEQEE
jgi:transcriptional regulator with XRE-family HTH domain